MTKVRVDCCLSADLDLSRQRAGVLERFRGHAVRLRRADSGRHEAGFG